MTHPVGESNYIFFQTLCYNQAFHLLPPSLSSFTYQPFSLLSSPGDHSFVREEALPYSLQELHVDLCAEGQPWGQLHDYHDCHYDSGQEEP